MWFNSTTVFTYSAVAEEEEAADADEDEMNEPIEEEDDESDQSILACARRAANAYPTHDWTECDATPTRSKRYVEIAVRAITHGIAWGSANASAATESIEEAAIAAAKASGIRHGRNYCSSCDGYSTCCSGCNCGTCSSCTRGEFCLRCFYIAAFTTGATKASV
jgi:hypothetical protein